jgi:PAS domain S-box-containing protein
MAWVFVCVLGVAMTALINALFIHFKNEKLIAQCLDDNRFQERSLWEALFIRASSAIFLADHLGVILIVNSALAALSGYRESELVGQPVQLILPNASVQIHFPDPLPHNDLPITGQHSGRITRMPLVLKSGTSVPAEIVIAQAFRCERPVFIAILRDRTRKHGLGPVELILDTNNQT